jgi:hypothetical protein
LHTEVVRQLEDWLATKKYLKPDGPLFAISGRVPDGRDCKTLKMIERDLMAAYDKFLKEAVKNKEEYND